MILFRTLLVGLFASQLLLLPLMNGNGRQRGDFWGEHGKEARAFAEAVAEVLDDDLTYLFSIESPPYVFRERMSSLVIDRFVSSRHPPHPDSPTGAEFREWANALYLKADLVLEMIRSQVLAHRAELSEAQYILDWYGEDHPLVQTFITVPADLSPMEWAKLIHDALPDGYYLPVDKLDAALADVMMNRRIPYSVDQIPLNRALDLLVDNLRRADWLLRPSGEIVITNFAQQAGFINERLDMAEPSERANSGKPRRQD